MYGLINQAVEDLVRTNHGHDAWRRILQRAGLPDVPFDMMDQYPDEVTYGLVMAASHILLITADDVLDAFGEHWVLYTAKEGYGDLLAMGGATLPEFLHNLHNLHSHVAIGFPHLRPPSFWCTDETGTSVRLHYQSTRAGLGEMVVGLLRGLGKLYRTPVTVSHLAKKADGADHDEFLVEYPALA